MHHDRRFTTLPFLVSKSNGRSLPEIAKILANKLGERDPNHQILSSSNCRGDRQSRGNHRNQAQPIGGETEANFLTPPKGDEPSEHWPEPGRGDNRPRVGAHGASLEIVA